MKKTTVINQSINQSISMNLLWRPTSRALRRQKYNANTRIYGVTNKQTNWRLLRLNEQTRQLRVRKRSNLTMEGLKHRSIKNSCRKSQEIRENNDETCIPLLVLLAVQILC